jgi:hypothetical protein
VEERMIGTEGQRRISPRAMKVAATVLIFGAWLYGVVLLFERDNRRPPEWAGTGILPAVDSPARDYRGRELAASAAVEEFRRFVVRSGTMEGDDTYSSTGLHYLADAIEALASRDRHDHVGVRSDSLRIAADRLRDDPYSDEHVETARRALITGSELMRTLRRLELPEHEGLAQPVVEAAEAIEPGKLLLEQRNQVRSYFERSYELVDRIARRVTSS